MENAGQLEKSVVFHSLHPEGVLVNRDGSIRIGDVTLEFGSIPSRIRGRHTSIESVSFFREGLTLSRLPAYRGVLLEGIYPSIDAEVLFIDGNLEIQFFVHPGGDPRSIVVRVSGGEVGREGDGVAIRTGGGVLGIGRIGAYQGAERVPVDVVVRGNSISFRVGEYDTSWSLVIDPVITTLVASPQDDYGFDMAVDGEGSVYVAGATLYSYMFAPERYYFGSVSGRDVADVFVTKLSPDLSTHIATAIIGSCGSDHARGVEVGADGSVYVAGWTTCSSTFAPDRSFFGDTGGVDVFVSRLSSSLDEHLSTAIVSSAGSDYAYGLSIGPDGSVYVAGYTDDYSTFAPSRVVFGETGSYDAFVSRLSSDLSAHLNTAIVGSGGMDGAMDVMVDDSGSVFLSGYTWSSGTFAPDRVFFGNSGSMDAFVSRLSSDLNAHFSTAILASPGLESGNALYVSSSGAVYIGGWTDSPEDFAPHRTIVGSTGALDGFVSALSHSLDGHLGSLVLASEGDDGVEAIGMYDSLLALSGYAGDGNGFASGGTVVGNPGGSDAFVALVDTSLLRVASIVILASDSDDVARSLETPEGGIYVAGYTRGTSGFVEGAAYMGVGGASDAFVSRLDYPVVASREGWDGGILLEGGSVGLILDGPEYVGFEVYSPDGRLLVRRSMGILPSGFHRIPLGGLKGGTYVLRLRVGGVVKNLKIVVN